MPRRFFLVAALAVTASVAQADHDRFKWDGAMRIISASPECGGQFTSDEGNEHVRFHPQLESEAPESSFTRFDGSGAEMIKKDGGGQFNGMGDYIIYRIGGGEFTEASSGEYLSLTYNFIQTPPVVTQSTVFVSLVGSLYNYHGIEDCTLRLRGTFVRVDPEIQ